MAAFRSYPTGIPLSPTADMARTAQFAMEMIASVRPPVFITVINMEITRHNSLIQSAQTLNVSLSNAVIVRAKEELMRILGMLINKSPQRYNVLYTTQISVLFVRSLL